MSPPNQTPSAPTTSRPPIKLEPSLLLQHQNSPQYPTSSPKPQPRTPQPQHQLLPPSSTHSTPHRTSNTGTPQLQHQTLPAGTPLQHGSSGAPSASSALKHPESSLAILPGMFHLALLGTSEIFTSRAATNAPHAIAHENARINQVIPTAIDRFHFGLDQLEMDIIRAKEVLRRDYEEKVKEREERERVEKEAEEKRLREEAERATAEHETEQDVEMGGMEDGNMGQEQGNGQGGSFDAFLEGVAEVAVGGGGFGQGQGGQDEMMGGYEGGGGEQHPNEQNFDDMFFE